MTNIDFDQVHHFIEIRGVYDGWSIAVMNSGEYINRWDKETQYQRWSATEHYIEGELSWSDLTRKVQSEWPE